MSDNTSEQSLSLIAQASDIVSAYVSNNSVPAAELPALLSGIHTALLGLGSSAGSTAQEEDIAKPTPAQIRKSMTHEALISFIDGKPYKTLKRHLSKQGLDPASYRTKFGLPNDYPMTAPSYSEKRSALARSLGLGQKVQKASEEAKTTSTKGGRGRKSAEHAQAA